MIERLKNLREDHDFTQEYVAKLLHCSQRTYSYYERGEHELPISVLIHLAKIYNTTTDYILGISDKITTDEYI